MLHSLLFSIVATTALTWRSPAVAMRYREVGLLFMSRSCPPQTAAVTPDSGRGVAFAEAAILPSTKESEEVQQEKKERTEEKETTSYSLLFGFSSFAIIWITGHYRALFHCISSLFRYAFRLFSFMFLPFALRIHLTLYSWSLPRETATEREKDTHTHQQRQQPKKKKNNKEKKKG